MPLVSLEVYGPALELFVAERSPVHELAEIDGVGVETLAKTNKVGHLVKVILLNNHAETEPFERTFASQTLNEGEILEQPAEIAASAVDCICFGCGGID